MYNSAYSQANFGLAAKKMHKSKGKSCGYYMKIVFFFSSLIQSLIIASLVLFLVYGQPEHTVEEKRLQELDQSVSKLTMDNFILRGKEKNLTKTLNITLTAKLKNDKLVSELRRLANVSSVAIKSMQTTLSRYETERKMTTAPRSCPPTYCPDSNENNKRLQSMVQQSEDILKLVRANFTEKMTNMRYELDTSNKDKEMYHLEAITLRRDKAFLDQELNLYQKKCKEDFVDSLRGIPSVTKEFLKRIDDLFSKHISFQLTCDKQRIQLEDIRENCSSLSREVENKLQAYLDTVGEQFTKINGANARYMIDNIRLKEDADWCSQNRTAIMRKNRKALDELQIKNDQESEKLLLENRKLKGENNLKENLVAVKDAEIKMLKNTVETLNTTLVSCKPTMRTGSFMPNSFGSPSFPSSTGLNKPSMPWSGTGSTGSAFPSFTGAGSSTSTRWGGTGAGVTGQSNTALGGTGTLLGGLGSPGLGSSRTGLGVAQTGTSGLGGVGPGLTGQGGAGSSLAGTGNIGLGTGSTAFSGAAGMAKPAIGGTGFSSIGSNPYGVGIGGTRTTGVVSDSQTISQAQINLHLKELLRYSLPV